MGFFGDFFGSSARRDIRNSNKKANAALDAGYGQQQGYYNQAAGQFSPYAQQGGAANTFYGNALGLNGADAQAGSIDTLTNNPLFQGQLANDSNALMRSLNARGQSGGGLANIAAQRVFQQTAGDWLNRYRDAGQQGFQAAGQIAGVRMGQGDNAMGYGATKAGNAINYGNAMASARNIGVNNLMGAIGTGIKAYTAFK